MFTGWGIRTLTSDSPAYNPISYQRGSVWPFDTMIAAAGLWRYGEYAKAFALIKAVLDAAARFESCRLPELFGGFDRSYGAPVPYQSANIPQAWSAAAPLLATQLMLGIVPDAPRGRCYFQPQLPDWLPRLALANLEIGNGKCEIIVRHNGDQTIIEHLKCEGVEAVCRMPKAPLWGHPPSLNAG
jgi:glycogen debranching enzyme